MAEAIKKMRISHSDATYYIVENMYHHIIAIHFNIAAGCETDTPQNLALKVCQMSRLEGT